MITHGRRTPASRTRRTVLIPLVMFGMLLLSACDGADADFAADLAQSWAQEKGLLTASGDVNVINIGILYGQRAMFGTTGDSDVDAALTAGPVVNGIRDADALASQGAQMGGEDGLASIDKAISLRPQDWGYYEQKGALLLAEGRDEEAEEAFSTSNALARSHLEEGGDCRMYARNMLTQREQALLTQINRAYDQGLQPADELIDRLDSVRTELQLLPTPLGSCG